LLEYQNFFAALLTMFESLT